jgi:predicted aldo/keto reductase-like oxidoreductase
MRLPRIDPDDWTKVDMDATREMIDRFMAEDFSYFDTAYVYHGASSERLFGELIAKRYPRDAFTITTKMPVFNADYVKSEEDYQRIFKEQLERCQVNYFDYYFLHGIGKNRLDDIERLRGFEFMQQKKAEGKIRHIGFSYHDDAETLEQILTDHPETELVQLQLNYIDWNDESVQAQRCYEVCVKHGVKVAVMEPLKGGALTRLPEAAADILKEANPNVSLASWGIRFAASLDNVMVVLSGMSDMEQMEDNIGYMRDFEPLTGEETETINKTVNIIRDSIAVPCTACRYCTSGCPKNIAIPEYIALYNNQKQFGLLPGLASNYLNLTVKYGKPDDCIGCNQCEENCPQHLSVQKNLKMVAKTFGQ